jgi:hypothetical protein
MKLQCKWVWLTVDAFADIARKTPEWTRRAIERRENIERGIYPDGPTLYAVRGDDGEYRIPVAIYEGKAFAFDKRASYEAFLVTGDEYYAIPLPYSAVERLAQSNTE